jgi:hypothetical protein
MRQGKKNEFKTSRWKFDERGPGRSRSCSLLRANIETHKSNKREKKKTKEMCIARSTDAIPKC